MRLTPHRWETTYDDDDIQESGLGVDTASISHHNASLSPTVFLSPITAPPSFSLSLCRCLLSPITEWLPPSSLPPSPSSSPLHHLSPSLSPLHHLFPSLSLLSPSLPTPSLHCRRFFATTSHILTVPVPDSLSLTLFPPSSTSLSLPSFFSDRGPLRYPASAARFLSPLLQQLIFKLFLRQHASSACFSLKTKVYILCPPDPNKNLKLACKMRFE
ncbi:hypothetical protein ACLOJK_015537 [Asimina triloba]